jgi:hypothetical protein
MAGGGDLQDRKGRPRLGQSQVRTYTAVNRHTALTALAGLRQACARALHAAESGDQDIDHDAGPASPTGDAGRDPKPDPAHRRPAQTNPVDLADPGIPLGDSPVPVTADQPRPADLGHIKLSVAEHHRLHHLARQKAAGLLTAAAEAFHLHWSRLRRRHQAIARWHHYRRRLREALDTG